MKIKELADKYNLDRGDFWEHKQSGQWIIKHDAIEKIAAIENIQLDEWIDIPPFERDLYRCRITMSMVDQETGEPREVQTIGEADPKNCMSKYYAMMGEKRAKDRAILKLIRAYEYGISSEVEADDFKQAKPIAKTEEQKERFHNALAYKCFDGKKREYQERFKKATFQEVEDLFIEMKNIIKESK